MIKHILIFLITVSIITLGFLSSQNYVGHIGYYLLFSFSFNFLLFRGFSSNKSFFDTFLGLFFWLGFWFKYSVRVAFMNGVFGDIGNFNNSGASHDRVLLISSLAAVGFLCASFIREKFIFSYKKLNDAKAHTGGAFFYNQHRMKIILFFVIIAVLIPLANAYLGIYQRGSIPRTSLPFGMNGIVTWLVFFGLSSVFSYIINFEVRTSQKASIWMILLGFSEITFSNLSMLSRGFFLNGSALLFGLNESFKKLKIEGLRQFYLRLSGILVILILISVFATSIIRMYRFADQGTTWNISIAKNSGDIIANSSALIVDRWLGIEGVMAVSSSNRLGPELWREGWAEKYKSSGTSFYDKTIISSSYKNDDVANHHFVTMPGIVGFFFYHGNIYWLFVSMVGLGLFAAFVELFVYNFGGGNLFLCSLMAEVVAYRFAHFGYVPAQSYLLFGTIIGNILVFYFLNKFFVFIYKNKLKIT